MKFPKPPRFAGLGQLLRELDPLPPLVTTEYGPKLYHWDGCRFVPAEQRAQTKKQEVKA